MLSGGKSTRMGLDKGMIAYHGIPQRQYLYRLLDECCDRAFMSIREEQQAGVDGSVDVIVDLDRVRGPFNGLLSAHDRYPAAAWLVLACDLPLIDEASLAYLIANRDQGKLATAYARRDSGLPEPLCAIWEPAAFDKAEQWLASGSSTCPRKFLLSKEIRLVHPEDDRVLLNANSREEYREVMRELA